MGLDLLIAHEIFKLLPDDDVTLLNMNRTSLKLLSPAATTDSTPLILECLLSSPSKLSDPISRSSSSESKVDEALHLPKVFPPPGTELANRKDRQIKDALEILQAMRQSCETAVWTLNDVLLYDKIVGGTMVLEKRHILVPHLLTDAVKPFFLQVLPLTPQPHSLTSLVLLRPV
jgi:hypothetical protein